MANLMLVHEKKIAVSNLIVMLNEHLDEKSRDYFDSHGFLKNDFL